MGNPKKTKFNFAWLLVILFAVLVANIFLKKPAVTIAWTEDHDAGFKQAKEQGKPVLLIFWKPGHDMCKGAMRETYTNPKVIEFVEKNYITIFVDETKQPDLFKRYKVDYYPLQLVLFSPDDTPIKEIRGFDPPQLFIQKLTDAMQKIESENK
jgi:thioredoxin-related protein